MTNTLAIAKDLVAMCREARFDEAGEKYWAADVVSVEPAGDAAVSRGIAAARAKGEAWMSANEIHGFEAGDPYVNGDQFVVRFSIDQTVKATGERMKLDEVGIYTLKNGKIAEERFFYGA
ncbi:MAG TPA: nuclear transport factor 2 family protein [Parvibaculum sp.]